MNRRPKPRRITTADSDEDEPPAPVIRPKKTKPTPSTTSVTSTTSVGPTPTSSKSKKPLRLSFAPAAAEPEGEDSEPVFVPKKSALSQKATARALARRNAPTLESTPSQDRVSYSAEYLARLKAEQNLTPTVEDGDILAIPPDDSADGDTPGADVVMYDAPAATSIPDSGLVRILKQRRAEKAREPQGAQDDRDDDEDFISLSLSREKNKGRLQPLEDDDEEMAAFIEDADRPILENTRRAQREAEIRRKKRIAEAIAMEEEEEEDEEAEEFDEEQIRAGAGGGRRKGLEELLAEAPAVGKVPVMRDVVERLEGLLREVKGRRYGVEKVLAGVREEKMEILGREGELKKRLEEAGGKYEKLRKELGLGGMQEEGDGVVKMRGLENIGGTPVGGTPIRAE